MTDIEWKDLLSKHKEAKQAVSSAEYDGRGLKEAKQRLFDINKDIRRFVAQENWERHRDSQQLRGEI